MNPGKRIELEFFRRPALTVAPELLGKSLVSEIGGLRTSGTISEVEVYQAHDAASHSFRGKTPRNSSMWLGAGYWYVYSIYGIHTCLNIVTGLSKEGSAILIRAIQPSEGIEHMTIRRGNITQVTQLTNGPGKVCQALGITRAFDSVFSLSSDLLWIEHQEHPPIKVQVGPRIGITKATDMPWRFWYT